MHAFDEQQHDSRPQVLVGHRIIAPTHVPVVPVTSGKSLERAIALAHDDSTCGHEPLQPPPAPTVGAATSAGYTQSVVALPSDARCASDRSSVHGSGSKHGSRRRTFRESLAGVLKWVISRHGATRKSTATEDMTPSARHDSETLPSVSRASVAECSGSGHWGTNCSQADEVSGTWSSRSNFHTLQRAPSDEVVLLSARLSDQHLHQRSQAPSAQVYIPSSGGGSGGSRDINAAPVLCRQPGDPSWPPLNLQDMSPVEKKQMLESTGANEFISQPDVDSGSSELLYWTALSEHESCEAAGHVRGSSVTRQAPRRGGHKWLLSAHEGDLQEQPAHAALGQHCTGSGHGSASTAASQVEIVPDGMKAAGGHHASLYAAGLPTTSDAVPAAASQARTAPIRRGAAGGSYVPPAPAAQQPAPVFCGVFAMPDCEDSAGAASPANSLAAPDCVGSASIDNSPLPASGLGGRMRWCPITDSAADAGPVAEGDPGEPNTAEIAQSAGPYAQQGSAQHALPPSAAAPNISGLDASGAAHDVHKMSPTSSQSQVCEQRARWPEQAQPGHAVCSGAAAHSDRAWRRHHGCSTACGAAATSCIGAAAACDHRPR
jgi:hypothetical protein